MAAPWTFRNGVCSADLAWIQPDEDDYRTRSSNRLRLRKTKTREKDYIGVLLDSDLLWFKTGDAERVTRESLLATH